MDEPFCNLKEINCLDSRAVFKPRQNNLGGPQYFGPSSTRLLLVLFIRQNLLFSNSTRTHRVEPF
jgi:hypothetical protein